MNVCLVWLSLTVVQSFDSLPPPTPMPAILEPAPLQPVTLADFAASFKPAAGNYDVIFLHPVKCCPVKVSFCLPEGCPKIRVYKRMLVFDYGHHHYVRIRFKILGGGVVVTSR